MIDTAAFYDNNPGPGSWQKPTLQALAAETDVDDMGDSAQSAQLSDEQCLLASGVVCGFDLKIKDWCKCLPALRSPSSSLLTIFHRPVPCRWNQRHHLQQPRIRQACVAAR